eukprot:EC713144.1.p4 GENE.EC713144.1~~EC713144.1.p4  ORF type:complete len:50 (-),score=3.80 EC713144.1:8-157(-)
MKKTGKNDGEKQTSQNARQIVKRVIALALVRNAIARATMEYTHYTYPRP